MSSDRLYRKQISSDVENPITAYFQYSTSPRENGAVEINYVSLVSEKSNKNFLADLGIKKYEGKILIYDVGKDPKEKEVSMHAKKIANSFFHMIEQEKKIYDSIDQKTEEEFQSSEEAIFNCLSEDYDGLIKKNIDKIPIDIQDKEQLSLKHAKGETVQERLRNSMAEFKHQVGYGIENTLNRARDYGDVYELFDKELRRYDKELLRLVNTINSRKNITAEQSLKINDIFAKLYQKRVEIENTKQTFREKRSEEYEEKRKLTKYFREKLFPDMFGEFTKDVKKVLTKYSQRIQANDKNKYGYHSSPDKIRILDNIENLRKSYKNWKNGLNNIEFQESVSFEKSLDNLEAMMDSKFNKLYDDWERHNRGAFTEDQILDLEEYCRNLESDNSDNQADVNSDEDMRISKDDLDELLSAGVVVNETKEGSADEAAPDQYNLEDETKLQLSVEELDPESKDELFG